MNRIGNALLGLLFAVSCQTASSEKIYEPTPSPMQTPIVATQGPKSIPTILSTPSSTAQSTSIPTPSPSIAISVREPTSQSITPLPQTLGNYPAEINRCVSDVKRVNLSFDAGAGTQSISSVLQALDRYHVKGTFFLTGQWANQNPGLTQIIASYGHEIFNHTLDHAPRNPDHPGLTNYNDDEIKWELDEAEKIIAKLTGKTTKPYMRMPYGDRDSRVLAASWKAGYRSVYWTVDALDWMEGNGATEASVYTRVMKNLAPGNIYLFHIGDNLTGRLLDGLISSIRNQGYEIVTLQDCMK